MRLQIFLVIFLIVNAIYVPCSSEIINLALRRECFASSQQNESFPSNLAQGKPGYASSQENDSFPPSNAFDGNMATR